MEITKEMARRLLSAGLQYYPEQGLKYYTIATDEWKLLNLESAKRLLEFVINGEQEQQ